MKTPTLIFLVSILLISYDSFSQNLPKRPNTSELRSFNQTNLMQVGMGMPKDEVIIKMGGIQSIQLYELNQFTRMKYAVVNNPYSRDMRVDNQGNSIEILWYYTDVKSDDGAIQKDELTPIILENNKTIGLGWGFYEDYSKRKELNINVN